LKKKKKEKEEKRKEDEEEEAWLMGLKWRRKGQQQWQLKGEERREEANGTYSDLV